MTDDLRREAEALAKQLFGHRYTQGDVDRLITFAKAQRAAEREIIRQQVMKGCTCDYAKCHPEFWKAYAELHQWLNQRAKE